MQFFNPALIGRVGVFRMDKETNVLTEEERLSAKIEEILAKINSDPNPEELEELKKIIKKKVPFTRRSYFAAMLLKMLTAKPERRERAPREKKKEFVKKEAKEAVKPAKENAEEAPKPEKVLPEDAKTLYLNIGKMKHLYGKDLSKLLQSELSITREDIYSLRVHDKYSFITMSEANCIKAIELLNGRDINGRTAQLNFSNR
jgi:hypothetical protein